MAVHTVLVIPNRLGRQNEKTGPETSRHEPFLHSIPHMTIRLVVLTALVLAAAAPSAEAQRSRGSRPIEFGIDGGIAFGLDNPSLTVVGLPVQNFRMGILMSPKIAIEPRLTINSIRGSGASLTTYAFETGVVYSPAGDRVGKGLYGRPFLGVSGVSASGVNDNSGYAGLGVGLKLPFADRRLATRLETNYAHGFGTGGSNQVGLLIGLSFFTR